MSAQPARSTKLRNDADSHIGQGTVVEGNITFYGRLTIDGQVNGSITAGSGGVGLLCISDLATVNGEVRASRATIDGAVKGNVTASDFVEIQSRGRVSGDVRYGSIEIQLGAVIEGRLIHDDADSAGKVVALKPTSVSTEERKADD